MPYEIHYNKSNIANIVELKNSTLGAFAKINLKEGARLEALQLADLTIIDATLLPYNKTYSSAILFPFVNRVKGGSYTYLQNKYQLTCNEIEKNNALHGLVFNKQFELVNQQNTVDFASATLSYQETKREEGFPYLYTIKITYTLTENDLILTLDVTNNDEVSFPFTIGWHPYFKSKNLHQSNLLFNSKRTYLFDQQMIPISSVDEFTKKNLSFKGNKYDDCFELHDCKVQFQTPSYDMIMKSSVKNNFFQVYTPPQKNMVALELQTGISDSFNSKIGLQKLEPNENYTINWTININKTK